MERALAIAISLLVSPAVHASGWCVGVSGSFSSLSGWDAGRIDDGSFTDSSGNPTRSGTDHQSLGFRLFGEYKLSGRLSLEAGYADLGSWSVYGTSNGSAVWNAGRVSRELSASGFDFAAVGRLPIGSLWALTGRVGALRWATDTSTRNSGLNSSGGDSGAGPIFGLGVERAFGKFTLRADITRYSLDSNDVDSFALSFVLPL